MQRSRFLIVDCRLLTRLALSDFVLNKGAHCPTLREFPGIRVDKVIAFT